MSSVTAEKRKHRESWLGKVKYWMNLQYSSELFGLPESEFANETFADFVERVAYGLAHSVVDQHWSPLADNCDMRTWLPAYDLVIRYQHGDDMNVLLDCVLATVARRSRDPAALTKMRNTFDHTSADAKKHGTNGWKK